MKNILLMLSIVALMQACDNSSKPTSTATPPPTAAPAAPQATPSTTEIEAKNIDFAKKTSAAIQGRWRSTIDPKSEIKIEGDKWTDVYDGKELGTSQNKLEIKSGMST